MKTILFILQMAEEDIYELTPSQDVRRMIAAEDDHEYFKLKEGDVIEYNYTSGFTKGTAVVDKILYQTPAGSFRQCGEPHFIIYLKSLEERSCL